jgi:hypothetical protein
MEYPMNQPLFLIKNPTVEINQTGKGLNLCFDGIMYSKVACCNGDNEFDFDFIGREFVMALNKAKKKIDGDES